MASERRRRSGGGGGGNGGGAPWRNPWAMAQAVREACQGHICSPWQLQLVRPHSASVQLSVDDVTN